MGTHHGHLRVVEPKPEPPRDEEESALPLDVDQAFRRYAPYVARVALRVLGDADEVEDVVQEVFLVAQRGIKSVREPSALKGWLATITVRQVHRVIRRRKLRRLIGLERLPDPTALLGDDALQEDKAVLVEIYRVLEGLPAKARIAWVLRHVEGESLDRVAELCGCSRATAHRRVVQARAALQEALDDGR